MWFIYCPVFSYMKDYATKGNSFEGYLSILIVSVAKTELRHEVRKLKETCDHIKGYVY